MVGFSAAILEDFQSVYSTLSCNNVTSNLDVRMEISKEKYTNTKSADGHCSGIYTSRVRSTFLLPVRRDGTNGRVSVCWIRRGTFLKGRQRTLVLYSVKAIYIGS